MQDYSDLENVKREHIIALHEAYTHTNKQTSAKRAKRLLELLTMLKNFDQKRNVLVWDESQPKIK